MRETEPRSAHFMVHVKNAHQIRWRLWCGGVLLRWALKMLNTPAAGLRVVPFR